MRNKCPVCHSTNIHRLHTARRIGSTVGAVGGAATGAGGALSGAQTGAAVGACQSASNSFQVSASKSFQLLRLI